VYDLVLKNGKIIDGTGARWFPGDLGISNGRIKKIGTLEGGSKNFATYEEPAQFPLGIEYFIVNGVVVVSEGQHTDATPGKLLKHRSMPFICQIA